jgi:DNA-binding transcriptional LysR family regulator
VGSISQAAKNLYVGQPNLSRILKEVEDAVGFAIFDRTHQGIRPTERGMTFLQHAHNILREMDAIETMGSGQAEGNRLRGCIPHSTAAFYAISQYLVQLIEKKRVNAVIRECHPRKTLDLIAGGQAEIGVIRFREEYRQYFAELAAAANLKFVFLRNYEDLVLLDKNHPLAAKEVLSRSDFADYPLIVHSDRYFLPEQKTEKGSSKIYTVDRHAQLTLLRSLPGSYIWSAPISKAMQDEWGVVQRNCEKNTNRYSEALIYNPSYIMSELEANFMEMLKVEYPKMIWE